jgi:selenocysteine lyase/cysteine desulfurase
MEAGTQNLVGIAGLVAGQRYIKFRGMKEIRRHEMDLFRILLDGLLALENVTVYGPHDTENRVPVVSLNVAGLAAIDVGTLLDVDYGIAARTGLHCAPKVHEGLGTLEKGTVRLSLGPFTTEAHVRHALYALGEIASGKALGRNG